MTLQACAELVERADPDRFLAAMAAPPEARPVLFPIYAFNVEVSRAPWVTQESMIAEMRLQWWRDALAEIADGKQVRSHEVVTPLAALDRIDCGTLDRIVVARRWEIYREPFPNAAAFETYLDDTAAGLMWTAAQSLGAQDMSEVTVRDFGWAAGLAAFLVAVPELTARHRRPLLSDDLTWVRAIAEAGLGRIDRGRATLDRVPHQARPALYSGWLARSILRRAVSRPAVVKTGGLLPSEFSRKSRLLLAAFRGRP
jgi:phytoene/squalene synthetase